MNYAQRMSYEKYARIRASQAGLTVEFVPGEVTPHTTGSKLVVRSPDMAWSDGDWLQWYYEFLHEVGHQREPWREWKQVLEKYKVKRDFFGHALNLQSDHAQEHGGWGELKGVDIVLGEGRRGFVLSCKDKMKPPKDDEQAMWQAMWKYDALKREEWNPVLDGVSATLPLDPIAKPYYDKLMAWGKSASSCNNEWEVYEYTKELLAVLGLDPEQMEADNLKGEGTKAGGAEGGEEGAEGGEARTDGDESDGEGASSITEYVKPTLGHDHSSGEWGRDMHIDYSRHRRSDTYTMREREVKDFRKRMPPAGHRTLKCGVVNNNSFATRVRKLLQVRSRVQYQGGMNAGRVHAKSLWKTRVGDDHIFKQKVENLTLKDTAVTLLVDYSGSMGGDKIDHAAQACMLLNSAISTLGVKTCILGFADTGKPVELRIKMFNERLTNEQVRDRMQAGLHYMSQNADGESLLYAYHDLLQRPEKRKVLVVLSDGSPCSYADGDDDSFLSRVTKEIEQTGAVSLYGIGIMDKNVDRYYSHRTTIKRAEELESKLLEVVQKQILTA